jgi:hypothetical protein
VGTAIRVKTQKGGGGVYSKLFVGRKEQEKEKEDQHTYLPTLHLDAVGSFKKKHCKEMMT